MIFAITDQPVDWVLAAGIALFVAAGIVGCWLDRGPTRRRTR